MSIATMRWTLKYKTKYSKSKAWQAKVDRMPDAQVMAVYFRMSEANELIT